MNSKSYMAYPKLNRIIAAFFLVTGAANIVFYFFAYSGLVVFEFSLKDYAESTIDAVVRILLFIGLWRNRKWARSAAVIYTVVATGYVSIETIFVPLERASLFLSALFLINGWVVFYLAKIERGSEFLPKARVRQIAILLFAAGVFFAVSYVAGVITAFFAALAIFIGAGIRRAVKL